MRLLTTQICKIGNKQKLILFDKLKKIQIERNIYISIHLYISSFYQVVTLIFINEFRFNLLYTQSILFQN